MSDLIKQFKRNIEDIELEIRNIKEQLKIIQSKYKQFEQIEDPTYHYFCGYIHGLRKVIELVKSNIETFGDELKNNPETHHQHKGDDNDMLR